MWGRECEADSVMTIQTNNRKKLAVKYETDAIIPNLSTTTTILSMRITKEAKNAKKYFFLVQPEMFLSINNYKKP